MPEFVLNRPRKSAFDSLDPFARGYVEALFFTNGDTGDEQENRLNDMGVGRLTRASVAKIKRDCDKFRGLIMPDGCFVQQWLDRVDDYDAEQAGRDLWFTRQGHGVGYWEREALATPSGHGKTTGEHLSDAALTMGESYVEVWRGWIHVR